jgi:hypothetical protein
MAKRNGGIIGKVNTPTTSVATGVWRLQDQFNAKKNNIWPFVTYNIQVLLLAGGGGGGAGNGGGGGGAGGLLNTASVTLTPGTVYSLSAGAGGAFDTPGIDSTFSGTGTPTLTALKGGRGANNPNQGGQGVTPGSFGSGGGSSRDNTQLGGYGTSGQGNDGNIPVSNNTAGGGGGANAAGTTSSGGNGSSTYSSILSPVSLPTTVAGGGGGSSYSFSSAPLGGSGGGGNGAYRGGNFGSNGTALTGGGGGGGVSANLGPWNIGSAVTYTGGSGWCVLVIPTSNYSGVTTGSPTVATSGANTILSYTGTGTYTA